jgi:hypothetical protein
MATLNEVMIQTADAIREKTGKSELIAPVDFASEIKGITAGGESASTIEYLDVSNYDFSQAGEMGIAFSALCSVSSNIKTGVAGEKVTCPWGLIVQLYGNSAGVNKEIAPQTRAFAIDPEMTIPDFSNFSSEGVKIITVVEYLRAVLSDNGVDYDSIPRITKEQFYDLNA